jgi:subtilase family serine protease
MRARIRNAGTGRASEFVVAFFVERRQTGTYGPVPVGRGSGAGGQCLAPANRKPCGQGVVDPDNKVRESDEADNAKEVTLKLTDKLRDSRPTD